MTTMPRVDTAIVIRPMHIGDLDPVLAIESGSFGSPWSRNHFVDELNNPDLSVPLIVEYRQAIGGYAVVWIIMDECHLANIAVHPEFRRHGLGRHLMSRILDIARERGCSRVMLEVRATNEPAVALYESYGFVRVGIRKNYYHDGFLKTEDGILMDLDLTHGNKT